MRAVGAAAPTVRPMSNAATAFEALKADEGSSQGTGDWFEVTQDQIDQFADCTVDHQFIHLDAERATPVFGGTIAHGFLTLSMLTHLVQSIPVTTPPFDGLMMGINYGLDTVRFLNPVLSGKRIRAHSTVKSVVQKGTAVNQTRTITVEIEGEDKPALVADWIGRFVFDS